MLIHILHINSRKKITFISKIKTYIFKHNNKFLKLYLNEIFNKSHLFMLPNYSALLLIKQIKGNNSDISYSNMYMNIEIFLLIWFPWSGQYLSTGPIMLDIKRSLHNSFISMQFDLIPIDFFYSGIMHV